MKVNFRQGVFSSRMINSSLTGFLLAGDYGFADLSAKENPLVVNFADGLNNYIVKVNQDVIKAWGSFGASPRTNYLYIDIRIRDGIVNYGSTVFAPVYSETDQFADNDTIPEIDQHWFDKTATKMKVWNGTAWVSKIRVFLGTYTAGAVTSVALGSSAGITEDVESGFIMYDEANLPIRVSSGAFFTTSDQANVKFSPSVSSVKLDQNVMVMEAVESIPHHALVYVAGENKIGLADSSDVMRMAIGIAENPVVAGETTNVFFRGLISNTDWSGVVEYSVSQFSEVNFGKSLYLGHTGKMSLIAPNTLSQKIGTILNKTSIYLDIDGLSSSGDLGNLQGPKGDAGPQGVDGDEGPAGPAGPAGADGAAGAAGGGSSGMEDVYVGPPMLNSLHVPS